MSSQEEKEFPLIDLSTIKEWTNLKTEYVNVLKDALKRKRIEIIRPEQIESSDILNKVKLKAIGKEIQPFMIHVKNHEICDKVDDVYDWKTMENCNKRFKLTKDHSTYRRASASSPCYIEESKQPHDGQTVGMRACMNQMNQQKSQSQVELMMDDSTDSLFEALAEFYAKKSFAREDAKECINEIIMVCYTSPFFQCGYASAD